MAKKYENFGGFEIPRKDRIVDHKGIDKFWAMVEQNTAGLSIAKGCYIFAIRAGRGIRPWYVGKACGRMGFKQEVLADHKLKHYNGLIAGQQGTPLIFLIAARTNKKKFRKLMEAEAGWVENFLIALAVEANSGLLNKKNTVFLRDCIIPGLLNSPKGATLETTRIIRNLFSH